MTDTVYPAPTISRFPVVDVTEKVPLAFDFGPALPAGVVLTGPPQVSVAVDLGADPNPIGTILSGPTVAGCVVVLGVGNFQATADTDYHYKITCPTSDPALQLALSGLLSVRML
jgi:hypothetical protein